MIDLTRKYTLADVRRWGPCYEMDQLYALADKLGKTEATLPEILDLPIPAEDRLWIVLHEDVLPAAVLHELACRFAEAVLPIFEAARPGDTRPRDAIAAKWAWLRGDIGDSDLAAARNAAWDAAAVPAAVSDPGAAAGAAAASAARASAAAAAAAAWASAVAAAASQLGIVRSLIAEHTK